MTARHMPCRSCGRAGLEPILSLGATPLANALLTRAQLERSEPTYPLDLALCPGCTLVQLTTAVPPAALFDDYVYFSSFSDTMLRHARGLAETIAASRRLGAEHLVVEAASNDGYLLQFYRERGVPVCGIEPARNVARVAERERRIPTVCEYFGPALARRLAAAGRMADVFHAHNVLAHVPDPNGFVEGMRILLKEGGTDGGSGGGAGGGSGGGLAVVEVPYLKEMCDRVEYDTIYHEHQCYFSLTALDRLFRRHGLEVTRVERHPIHGGSLRLYVEHLAATRRPDPSVRALLDEEAGWGVGAPGFYRRFARRAGALRGALKGLLTDLKAGGRRIAAYGAAAKGSTLLNTLGLEPGTILFVADRSPHKQGKYMPGVRLPIVPPDRLLADMPDDVLLLAWNLADEVLAQEEEYLKRGGRFIIPLPEPKIVQAPAGAPPA